MDKSSAVETGNDAVVEMEPIGEKVESASSEPATPPPEYNEDEESEKATVDDPWALVIPKDTGKRWKEMSLCEKLGRVFINSLKGVAVLVLLYFFIIAIDLLGSSFQLMAGRTAGKAFTNSELLNNPVCCLMIGVGVTVLLQSSSTSTSIVVTMVAAGIIPVQNAIYIIMGANIGTTVTNTIVSLGQVADRNEFRRAFAGATVHDVFNWLSVLILLPIEVATGYLYHLTGAIVATMNIDADVDDEPMFLEVITDPLTSKIISVDKSVIYGIAEDSFVAKRPLTKYLCHEDPIQQCVDFAPDVDVVKSEAYLEVKNSRLFPDYWAINEKVIYSNFTCNGTVAESQLFTYDLPSFNKSWETETCSHWFTGAGMPGGSYDHPEGWKELNMSDGGVGAVLLVLSLLLLCGCLIGMVKVLSSLLKGPALKVVHSVINTDLQCGNNPPRWARVLGREMSGYMSMLVGCGLTILVQSSSVFTSALTPLVGMGLITVERMYPLTLGSNIGTTMTAILAAFTSSPDTIQDALQVALAHLFFNISGILIFYPIPFMRKIPITIAKKLGNIVAVYRWFAIAYLIIVYFIFPALVFALSIPGWYVLASVLIPVALVVTFVVIVNISQERCPTCLPTRLKSWAWCPSPLCSLEPYDRLFRRCCSCFKICRQDELESDSSDSNKVHPEDGEIIVTIKDGEIVEEVKIEDVSTQESDSGVANIAYENEDETIQISKL